MKILDAHHHLWNLSAVEYPWLNAKGKKRFFGDPTPIQRDYLIDEFKYEAQKQGVAGSVHIQVGAKKCPQRGALGAFSLRRKSRLANGSSSIL